MAGPDTGIAAGPREQDWLVGHEDGRTDAAARRRRRAAASRLAVRRPARHRQGDAGVPVRPLAAGRPRWREPGGRSGHAGGPPHRRRHPCRPARHRPRLRREAAARAAEIVVDEVRPIADFLRRTAAEGGRRVVILDEAELMNRSAANTLLKILEEPPPDAVLILVSSVPGRLLPTIRSRCRRLRLHPLAPPQMEAALARLLPAQDADRAGRWPRSPGARPARRWHSPRRTASPWRRWSARSWPTSRPAYPGPTPWPTSCCGRTAASRPS